MLISQIRYFHGGDTCGYTGNRYQFTYYKWKTLHIIPFFNSKRNLNRIAVLSPKSNRF